jgi:cellulase/cellobiase CelA1
VSRTLLAALLLAATAVPSVASAADDNPFQGATFYADPYANAAREAADDPANAEVWNRIAEHAQADWFGDWYAASEVERVAADRVATITGAGALPVFVVYAIPQRDCGGYSSGGTNTPADYQTWVDSFARGLGSARVAIVLEPDALPMLDCLSSADAATRLELLRWAVDRLNQQPGASVYLDAGNSHWVPAATMAERLRDANVAAARGFSLNVSNYHWTGDEVAYGTAVSDAIGGKPFVVDTSRNGLGPSTDPTDPETWCNPPGRALGTPPTAATGNARVDAYFWVKRPGESDGTCKGGPTAGSWWRDYALGLADGAPWAGDDTTTDEPVAEEPVAEEPVTEEPVIESATVAEVGYATSGGKHNDRHLTVTVLVHDGAGAPLGGVAVSGDVLRDGGVQLRGTATTAGDGRATFTIKNHPRGCYVTDVTLLEGAGFTVSDPSVPENRYAKGTTC